MWQLLTKLNNGLETNRLDFQVLERVFDTYWPQFEANFDAILKENPPKTVSPPRDEKDILAEILDTTRSMANRVRALEERSSIQISTPLGSRVIQGGGANTFRFAIERERMKEGINLINSFLNQGLRPDTIADKLISEHGYGKKETKELFEVLYAHGEAHGQD